MIYNSDWLTESFKSSEFTGLLGIVISNRRGETVIKSVWCGSDPFKANLPVEWRHLTGRPARDPAEMRTPPRWLLECRKPATGQGGRVRAGEKELAAPEASELQLGMLGMATVGAKLQKKVVGPCWG